MISLNARPVTLPARYAEPWRAAFDARVQPSLVPGVRILDVGSGRRPTIPPEQRPADCYYAGLDLFRAELDRAPAGSYDETHVADVVRHVPELDGRFDLVVSWQVLEHVKPLAKALENLRSYLRPGGRMVVQMSGRFSVFGMVNAVMPQRFGVIAMERLLRRDPETVFPAYYDRCWYNALCDLMETWSTFEILPRHRGAAYFGFFAPVYKVYLLYENWLSRKEYSNLATHYLVAAMK